VQDLTFELVLRSDAGFAAGVHAAVAAAWSFHSPSRRRSQPAGISARHIERTLRSGLKIRNVRPL
jgi:hypothetical protein